MALLESAFSIDEEEVIACLVKEYITTKVNQKTIERLEYVMKTYLLGNGEKPASDWKERKKETLLKLLKQTIGFRKKLELPTFSESIANKKFLEPGSHLLRAFKEGFLVLLERARMLFPRELAKIKRTKSLTSIIDANRTTLKLDRLMIASMIDKSSEQIAESGSTTINNLEKVSKFRKIITQLKKDMSHQEVRALNPTKIGRVCMLSTPHSKAVGLSENLAIGAKISKPVSPEKIEEITKKILQTSKGELDGILTVDDQYYGKINVKSAKEIFLAKRNNISHDLSLHIEDPTTLNIVTRKGRLLKPVYNVENKILSLENQQIDKDTSIEKLIRKRVLTYLDVTEELQSSVVLENSEITSDTQYLAMPLEAYLSELGLAIPVQHANAATRASLTLKFLKQALGVITTDKKEAARENIMKEFLLHSDNGLIRTPFTTKLPETPGQSVLVSLVSLEGSNSEDALVINKAAADRGLLSYVVYRNTYHEYPDRESDESAHAINPTAIINPNFDQRGILKLNAQIKKGDTIANLFTLTKFDPSEHLALLGTSNYEDHSKKSSSYTNASVNSVLLLKDKQSLSNLRITLKEVRRLGIGEKLTALSGQKGVISKEFEEYNLPLCAPGYVAGVFISTHVITQRMTLAPLIEMLLGKAAAIRGTPLTLGSFENFERYEQEARETLRNAKMDPDGRDLCLTVHNDFKLINTGILKMLLVCHHSVDKHYHRKKGKVQVLTKQPVQGKNLDGGLRFGEMQKAVTLDHCAQNFLEDRLAYDKVKVLVCTNCKVIIDSLRLRNSICHNCGAVETNNGFDTVIRSINIPYTVLLLVNTLRGAGIETLLDLE